MPPDGLRLRFIIGVVLIPGIAPAQTTQSTFEFHSNFWVNLHHALYNQAAGRKHGRNPDLSSLTRAEASTWNEALEYYERKVAGRDFLDFEMITIDKTLAGADDAGLHRVPRHLPPPLAEILRRAVPVYREHWWTEHDRKNREWVEGVTPLIARYEKTLRPALAHAYNTSWPKKRIRVEMSYYTTGNSAYTSLRPTLITISSWSQRNQGPAGLETIFHEAGHSLIQKVTDEISAAVNRTGRKLRQPDLWHAMLFYTSGELVQQCVPTLIPYAANMACGTIIGPTCFRS